MEARNATRIGRISRLFIGYGSRTPRMRNNVNVKMYNSAENVCGEMYREPKLANFKLAKLNFFISDLYKSRSEHCTNSGFSVGTLYISTYNNMKPQAPSSDLKVQKDS